MVLHRVGWGWGHEDQLNGVVATAVEVDQRISRKFPMSAQPRGAKAWHKAHAQPVCHHLP